LLLLHDWTRNISVRKRETHTLSFLLDFFLSGANGTILFFFFWVLGPPQVRAAAAATVYFSSFSSSTSLI
jgi:hypothetical protein